MFTAIALGFGLSGMLAMRVPKLAHNQGWLALLGGICGLAGVFSFAGLFPIRRACVPNFYTTYVNGTKQKEQADTCSYGGGFNCAWFASLFLFMSALW
eukprot:CAMPEP_0205905946 /NCGR_PEP_ID=MMETSP1325-20131115/1654_1 /ASSEMBLY_ACC=CAM_ASM_000708 /TAXON_ID=236786 /ORGANISM="Florenciella sp., Strain RCC1007" /LENGTH=97 /DNA_ID=CAMNT_0053271909 /DNA_START=139 /DNA_END=429 /DNA_ORIENTATION=+